MLIQLKGLQEIVTGGYSVNLRNDNYVAQYYLGSLGVMGEPN